MGTVATVNPAMLTWARNQSGNMTIDDVAERLKVPAERVADWEKGASFPSWSQLLSLAKWYRLPTVYFYMDSPPSDGRSLIDFRSSSETEVAKISSATPTLHQLSHQLGVPEPILLQEALEACLFNKIADTNHRIAKISQQYGTSSPDDIEVMIRMGTVEGHPAWEDAIRLEGLLEYRQKLWQQAIKSGEH